MKKTRKRKEQIQKSKENQNATKTMEEHPEKIKENQRNKQGKHTRIK